MRKKCQRCKTEKCKAGCLNYRGDHTSVIEMRRRKALNDQVEEMVVRGLPRDEGNMNTVAGRIKTKKHLKNVFLDIFTGFIGKATKFMIEVEIGLDNKKGKGFEANLVIKDFKMVNVKKVVDLNKPINALVLEIEDMVDDHQFEQSGLVLKNIRSVTVKALELNIVGRSYVELPGEIKNKRCCINIKNYDNKCFLWCVIAHFLIKEKKVSHLAKVSNYSKQEYIKRWDLSMVKFPMSLVDISVFESCNDITVNVYYYEELTKAINLMYPKEVREIKNEEKHVNLLLYKEHYCLIKNLNRLFSSYSSGHNKSYVCQGCGVAVFTTEKALERHKLNCGKGDYMVPKKLYLDFKNYQNTIEVPFIIYSDFESYFVNIENNELDTEKIVYNKIHKPLAFCYKTVCRSNEEYNSEMIYIEKDSDKKFAEELYHEAKRIEEILDEEVDMLEYDTEEFEKAEQCFICGKGFDEDDINFKKVRDHDHVNGEYRGAAHNVCNLQYTKLNYTIPVVFHNLEGYDLHLFIESLSKYTKRYDIIPKSREKYLSMCVNLVDSKVKLKFIDSLHFITGSLEENAKRLSKFRYTSHEILRAKQVFPYSYLTETGNKSINEILEEKRLPGRREEWLNDLTKEYTGEEDIRHAHRIFEMFECRNIRDYTLLYLRTDVVLLAEIFENFRDVSLKTYQLDPAWYYTTPGFAWVSF